MKKTQISNASLYNEDNLKVMATMPDESIDVICIDPPYLYLKNQKLERHFDEQKFFSECKRLLTKNGFIVMFGRGESFYRWNTILANLGFNFKEEIIWDKRYVTSPLMRLSRVHETISIFTKGKGSINKVKVPYLEMKGHDIDGVVKDIKQLKTTFKNTNSLNAVLEFLDSNKVPTYKESTESSFINSTIKSQNKCAAVMNTIQNGLKEKSIIKQCGDRYQTIHPTQKPIRLLERLLALVIPTDKDRKNIVVADFFAGSMSTMEAVHNMGMQGIATEIDEGYFEAGKKRIESLKEKLHTYETISNS
ncbi:DNA-methyltransferase [Riemerella anatipestifer]|uniref:DNA-methyltransferase n=1 Tax=Riemerella anatipestifer TaxID=34085 RepID=UPI002363CEAF|nr:site-specific DNA-methyltransferase [Riemerella anatipestifer]MDD1538630.1 site-specific DNA-methyltransferase [Riemerella anatipestifer]